MPTAFAFKPMPRLIFGAGRLAELPGLAATFASRVLVVVGGRSFVDGTAWREFRATCEDLKLSLSVEHIVTEPSPEIIDDIVNRHRLQAIGLVIAIGGGSVVDGGKAISAMLCEQGSVIDLLEGVGSSRPSGGKIPFIAVPTTSGTGSEATSNAVISRTGPDGFKKSLRHDAYIANVALIDPILALSCPRHLTIACGMDTFSQLVEAYLSTQASPLTDCLALEGIRSVHRSLVRACDEGQDLPARADLAYASFLSGVVLANAGLGTVHGFASAIGGLFAIPHGLVCARLMAPANRLTLQRLRQAGGSPAALAKYATLGRMVGDIANTSEASCQDAFIAYLDDLTSGLGLPPFPIASLTDRDCREIVRLTENKSNPIPLEGDDLQAILEASWVVR